MSGTEASPWTEATSLSRSAPREAASCAAGVPIVPARSARTVATVFMARISKNLIEHADQPPRIEVVFHQAAAEVLDAKLTDRRRRHDVPRREVRDADDTRQHDDLHVAVDVDFAYAFDHQIAVGQ